MAQEKTPSVKRLVFKSVPDEATRLAMLKRGEADIAYSIRGALAEDPPQVVADHPARARQPRPEAEPEERRAIPHERLGAVLDACSHVDAGGDALEVSRMRASIRDLQSRLEGDGCRTLGVAVIGIAVVVVGTVLLISRPDSPRALVEVLLLGVSLAVAAVPEGLEMLRDGGRYVVVGQYTDAGDVAINPHRHVNRRDHLG